MVMSGRQEFDCRELHRLIAACDDDDPDPALVSRVEQHIIDCEICQSADAALARNVQAYRDVMPAHVRPDLESEIANQLCRVVPKDK